MIQGLRKVLLAPFRKHHDPELQTWRDISSMLELGIDLWCFHNGKFYLIESACQNRSDRGYIWASLHDFDEPLWGFPVLLKAQGIKWTTLNPDLLKPITGWGATAGKHMDSYEDVAWEDMDSPR